MSEDSKKQKKTWQRRSFIKAGFAGLATAGVGFGVWKKKSAKRSPSSFFGSASWFGVKEREGQISFNGTAKLKDEYDMVIIGSGYGASVIAARMAKEWQGTGKTIAVLERGKEYLPGDFPQKASQIRIRNPLDRDGLFDINLGFTDESDLDVIGASGLGGTSLINAAIAIEPEKIVQEHTDWPKELRGSLGPYYQLARKGLKSNANDAEISNTRQSAIHQDIMKKMNVPGGTLELNINYDGSDDFGVDRDACTMCGDCCAGCNIGAKNILPYNYLQVAKDHGAEIFTYCEVENFGKIDDGYSVVIVDNSRKTLIPKAIKAKNIVLGAGSMGSTGLMLKAQARRSKRKFKFSKTLGSRLSLNGDVLGFCYNGLKKTNGIGVGTKLRNKAFREYGGSIGPMISTYGNYREKFKTTNLQKRFLLLEGSIPSAMAGFSAHFLAKWALENKDEVDTDFNGVTKYKKINFTEEQWKRVEMDIYKPMADKNDKDIELNPFDNNRLSDDGALNHSILFLSCGHDSSSGKYELDGFGNVQVKWPDVNKEDFFSEVTAEMKKVSEWMGGVYIPNPRTAMFGQGKMQATHPLGGCPMGSDHTTGTVNHKGQVFKDDGEVYEGLYVVDAAIIPRSLGATPLLTITALAERIFTFMKDDLG